MLLNITSIKQTNELANKIANIITPSFTITFNGELGVGKTTLIRYIIKSMGVLGTVKSPTYTLVESYLIKNIELHHFDLYRFNDKLEWLDSGFDEYFSNKSISFIEWPSKAEGLIKHVDWKLNIKISNDIRNIEIIALSTKGMECLSQLII